MIWLFCVWGLPAGARSQVGPDPQRPFGQGKVLSLPGTSTYVGDVPLQAWIEEALPQDHTVSGWLASKVGWGSFPGADLPGLGSGTRGILFEGVPYPIASNRIFNWLPSAGTVELLDFPAAAWWGPRTAEGAVQFRAPDFKDVPADQLALGGGTGLLLSAGDSFQGPGISLDGNWRHQESNGPAASNRAFLLTKARMGGEGGVSAETGFLGAESFSGDDWYVLLGNVTFHSPNFQSIQIKPYFQSAREGDRQVQEMGSNLNYHFNMGGLAESQVGLGFSHDDYLQGGFRSGANQGFAQATGLADVIGILTLNAAFRLDFSSARPTVFSTLIGLQGTEDLLTFMGNYGQGVLESTNEDARQWDAGIRLIPSDDWSLTAKYLHEAIGGQGWDGGRLECLYVNGRTVLWLFRKVSLRLVEQMLQGSSGVPSWDTGGKIEFCLFEREHWWFQGRILSPGAFYSEAGVDYPLADFLEVYGSAANLGNEPVSWPDPDAPWGRTFNAGIRCSF